MIARARRLYWRRVRRYAYEMCDTCGRPAGHAFGLRRERVLCTPANPDGRGDLAPITYWFAPNALWNKVIGSEGGIRCARCFTLDCRKTGLAIGWTCDLVGDLEDRVPRAEVAKAETAYRGLLLAGPDAQNHARIAYLNSSTGGMRDLEAARRAIAEAS